MKKHLLTTTLLATLAAGGAGGLQADELSSPSAALETNQAFGPGGVWTYIGMPQFMPITGTLPPYAVGSGYAAPDPADDTGYYRVQLNLPNGAKIETLYLNVYDNDATGSVFAQLVGAQAASDADDTPESKIFATDSTDTVAVPGYTQLSLTPSETLVIREQADFDGDGSGDAYYYIALGTNRGASATYNDIRFSGVAVQWSRTIAPAPVSASFNDVSTSYWAFREIEALANSGITTGCGAGNFCPDDTLTRAQMAAFLARALGLHWAQ